MRINKKVSSKKRVWIRPTNAYRLISKAYYLAMLVANSMDRYEFFKSLSMQFVWSRSHEILDVICYIELQSFSVFQWVSLSHMDLNFSFVHWIPLFWFHNCMLMTFILYVFLYIFLPFPKNRSFKKTLSLSKFSLKITNRYKSLQKFALMLPHGLILFT